MSIRLDVWGALGAQFLRLVVYSLSPTSSPDAETSETERDFDHPLDGLSDAKIDEVYGVAAHILKAAGSSSDDGRVKCREDAHAFFDLLSIHRDAVSDLPVASLSVEELRALLAQAWLPVGRSGDSLRNRLQQLAAATCNIRDALAGALHTPQIERRVWRSDSVATDGDIEYARAALGLTQLPVPSTLVEHSGFESSAVTRGAEGVMVVVPDYESESGAGDPLSPVLRGVVENTLQGRFSMLNGAPSLTKCF